MGKALGNINQILVKPLDLCLTYKVLRGNHMKTKALVIIGIIILAGGAALIIYLNVNNTDSSAKSLQAKTICELYLFDKNNPSVHSSYGKDYHISQWRAFETKFGSSGAKSIDEFCK